MSRIIIVFYANETKKSEESTYTIGSIYKKLQKYVKKHDKILYIGEERIDFWNKNMRITDSFLAQKV